MKETQEHLLLIFTRNPELGKCKTRLAATIGDRAALEVYEFLLRHTKNITAPLKAIKQVYYSDNIIKTDLWHAPTFEKKLQQGNDLGQRMQQAFKNGFNTGFKKIMVIGSDMYDLTQHDIENAFNALDKANVVVGPAQDGGYYLLGMTKMIDRLFYNKQWGTDSVLKATLKDIKNEHYVQLPEKNDVDYYEDIKDIAVFKPFLKHMHL